MDHRVNGLPPGRDGAHLPALWPVHRFLAQVNWPNRQALRPAPPPAAPPVAGRCVREFFTRINWTNAVRADDEGPALNLQSLDNVLAEFVWD